MPKLLLTGAAGFIGSHTTNALLKAGYSVVGVDNFNDYYNPDWKHQNLQQSLKHPNFNLVEADITDQEAMSNLFSTNDFDAVVHLAARAGVRPSIQDPLLYEQVNVKGTLILLELIRQYQIPQLVFASSSSVYGNQEKIPFSETDPVNQPISPYAATKKAGEMLAHTYAHLYGIKTTCLRFFTVYGPGGRPDMAPYLFTQWIHQGKPIKKFGDGTTKRDYTYIDDIVAGVVSAVKNPFDFEIINLGNNTPITLNEFISTIEEACGKKAKINQLPMQPGDVDLTYADITKAQTLLNYNPQTPFHEGIKRFVDWYKKNRL